MIILASIGLMKCFITGHLNSESLTLPGAAVNVTQEFMGLVNFEPVQSAGNVMTGHEISISGVVYKFSFVGKNDGGNPDVRMTFKIPKGYNSFITDVGIPDDVGIEQSNAAYFGMTLDGDEVKLPMTVSEPRLGRKAAHLELDIRGKSSMRFRFIDGVAMGFPRFTTKIAEASLVSSSNLIPVLRQPAEKAKVKGPSINLTWDSVDGATCYGINVVSFKSDQDQADDKPRIWSSTVIGTSYKFDLSTLLNGQYAWSVIAFGAKKPLGAFSKDRIFIVDK